MSHPLSSELELGELIVTNAICRCKPPELDLPGADEAKEYSPVWEASFNMDETPPRPKRPVKCLLKNATAYASTSCANIA